MLTFTTTAVCYFITFFNICLVQLEIGLSKKLQKFNFFIEFFKGLNGLYKRSNAAGLDLSLQLLLISGADDAVGGEKGVGRLYDFYKKCGVKDVTKYLIQGSRHEFLNEREHFEEAFGQISAFIKRLPVRKK